MSSSPGGIVAVGVLVGLVSTCIQSIGLTLQRKSHLLEEAREGDDEDYVRRPPYRRRRWQLGMGMFLVSNVIGSTIQITTLPLPVLSTLQASGLVFNTACASFLLGEPFTKSSILGTSLVAAGAVLIGIFGAMSEPSHALDQLLDLLVQPQFLGWALSTLAVVGIVLGGIVFLERLHPRPNHRIRLIIGMSYGGVSGVLSAHCLLLAKSAVELLVRTIVDRNNQFNRWQSWMILLGLVILALAQLFYLHRGLKLCSTSVLYPFVFCIYNVIAILDGLIYFRQTSRLSATHAALIAVGTVILLGGVFALSWRLDPEHNVADIVADGKPVSYGTLAPEASAAPPSLPTAPAPLTHNQAVQAPQSALAPGLGLLDAVPSSPTAAATSYLRPGDDEEALRFHADPHRARRASGGPDESTPLLRTRTMPMWRMRQNARQTSGSLRPQKARRLTAPAEDEGDLWEELNNDSNVRQFSGEYSPRALRSPTHSRISLNKGGYKRSGTLPTRLGQSSGVGNLLGSIRWPQMSDFTKAAGKKRQLDDSVDDYMPPQSTEDGDDTDEAEADTSLLRTNRWSLGAEQRRRSSGNIPQSDIGGWLKMRWWKRRWRDSHSGDDEEGQE